MNAYFHKAALYLSLLLALAATAACNTIGGIGEDMEAAGEEISEEAEEKKTY